MLVFLVTFVVIWSVFGIRPGPLALFYAILATLMLSSFGRISRKQMAGSGNGAKRICKNDRCRLINPPNARFCAQCGGRLN